MSEETDLTRVIEKIRKLLALANSGNLHEADTALKQATRLMDAHRLSMDAFEGKTASSTSTLDPVAIDENPIIAPAMKHARWKLQLFAQLCTHNGCRPMSQRRAVNAVKGKLVYQSSMVSIGRESDRLMVKFMFDFCVRSIDSLTKAHAASGVIKGARAHDAYRWGCVVGIRTSLETARRIEDQTRRHMQRPGSVAGSALAVIDTRLAQVEHWLANDNKEPISAKPRAMGSTAKTPHDGLALMRGVRDGESIRMPARPLIGDTGKPGEIASTVE